MDAGERDVVDALDRARAGDGEALGRVLAAFRPYLATLAAADLPADLRSRADRSDLVQDTLLEAQRDFARFDGSGAGDLRAWLRGILRNNLADWARRHRGAGKRAIARERPLDPGAPGLIDPRPTPRARAIARERADALDAALARLPPAERAAILLRNRDHLAFDEIGRRLGRSGEAARKLWARGVDRLRRTLPAETPR